MSISKTIFDNTRLNSHITLRLSRFLQNFLYNIRPTAQLKPKKKSQTQAAQITINTKTKNNGNKQN
jgi:hypothetical protein